MWILVVIAVAIRAALDVQVAEGTEMVTRLSNALATGSVTAVSLLALDFAFVAILVIMSIRRLNDLQRSWAWVLVLLLEIPLSIADANVPSNLDALGFFVSVLGLVPAVVLIVLLFMPGRELHHVEATTPRY
jgi:uncharacterized membrane protein YhaH (DUF805 family)